jgi:small conductance mechanosensitive channel
MPNVPYPTVALMLLAFVAAATFVRVARRAIGRALSALDAGRGPEAVKVRADRLVRPLQLVAYGVAALASVSMALSRLGIAEPSWDPRAVARWGVTRGFNAVVILAGAFIVIRVAHVAIEHLQFRLVPRHASADLEWQRRAATLRGIMTNVVNLSVAFVAGLMLLRQLSVDVLPILTGAGIAGLAVGFGAQNLVRDVISGFFLILEDQIRVGDLARINGVAGSVEQINLRTIVLRDQEGAVQVFPNGTITTLANLSKQFAYAVVDVRVAFNENLDRVMGTIREAGASMQADPQWRPHVLAPVELLGVESIDEKTATIRTRFKTQALDKGRVAAEFRRRLLGMLVNRGVRPYAG